MKTFTDMPEPQARTDDTTQLDRALRTKDEKPITPSRTSKLNGSLTIPMSGWAGGLGKSHENYAMGISEGKRIVYIIHG